MRVALIFLAAGCFSLGLACYLHGWAMHGSLIEVSVFKGIGIALLIWGVMVLDLRKEV